MKSGGSLWSREFWIGDNENSHHSESGHSPFKDKEINLTLVSFALSSRQSKAFQHDLWVGPTNFSHIPTPLITSIEYR